MFARNTISLLRAVACRMSRANLGSTRVCANVHSESCSNHKFTVFSNNSNWTINDSLRIGKEKEINTFWLRENCRCSDCYNLETQQRIVLFHKLNLNAFEVESLKEAGEGETIEVLWGDRHVSYYDKEWLRNNLANDQLHFKDKKQFLWNAETIVPYMRDKKIDFKSLVHDKVTLKAACENLHEMGFLQVENAPKSLDSTIQAAEQISGVKETFYGRKWEVNVMNNESPSSAEVKDSSYTNVEIGPHTDGNYFSEPPAILVFHHLKIAEEGGEVVLVDGFKMAEELKQSDPRSYEILSSYLVNFSYKDEKRYLNQTCPTFELDKATGNLKRVRYNHYDRSAHLEHSPSISSSAFYDALFRFSSLVEDPKNQVQLPLQPGTIFFIDNWRVFHARKAFKGHRVFVGCYMDRDKFLSNLRTL